jgi:hypothetical protein
MSPPPLSLSLSDILDVKKESQVDALMDTSDEPSGLIGTHDALDGTSQPIQEGYCIECEGRLPIHSPLHKLRIRFLLEFRPAGLISLRAMHR